jgi:hypothetical protein
MEKSLFSIKSPIVFALILAFATIDAQAGADLMVRYLDDIDKFNYYRDNHIGVDCYITNVGDETAYGILGELYASEDTTITSDDYYLDRRSYPSLQAGWNTTLDFWGTWHPADVPVGEYYLGVIVSCTDDPNLENGIAYISTPVSFNGSDLIVESIELSNFSHSEPDEVWVDYLVRNIGAWNSYSYFMSFYASSDTTINADDYRVGFLSHNGIEAGGVASHSTRIRFVDIPRGDYYVGITFRCDSDLDNTNNSICSNETLSIIPLPPDIIVQDVQVRDVQARAYLYRPGDQIHVYVLVENIGSGPADGYTVDYYASTDDNIESSDYHIGNVVRGPLERGGEDQFDTSFALPDDIPDGYYRIGVIVTWSYEGGSENTDSSSGRTIWVGPVPDLAVQAVEATSGTYLPEDEFVIYSLVENIGDEVSNSYTVDYYASTDASISKSDYHIGYVNRSGLAPGEQHSYNTTCQFPPNMPAGYYHIGIIITCPKEYDPANNVGSDNATVELVHPAGYICGQMRYKDKRDQQHPIRYALVKICEADNNYDPLDDPVIGQTHTGSGGYYSLTVLNDAGSDRQIYVKVFTEAVSRAYPGTTGGICQVKDDVFDQTYYLKSPLYPHPQDSSLVVNMTALPTGGEFMVYDSVIEGFHKARTFFGIELGEITTYWPCSDDQSYYVPSEGIFIAQDDRGDRDVIMHEYGHYIAEAYAFAQGSVGDNPVHFWDLDLRSNPVYRTDEQARNLAFREAWATLFGIATQYGDTGYPNSGDTWYQDVDESSGHTFDFDLEYAGDPQSPGQFYEHMNCCSLWDIFDDHSGRGDNHDTLSDARLSKIWAIVRCCRPDDIVDFWNGWFQRFDYEAEMTRIFQAHEMLFPVYTGPPTCMSAEIYVDDDAPGDPGPNDPTVSDPNEDGSLDHPFDAIQEAIDAAVDGLTIIVCEGRYDENINLSGKNITLTCRDPNDPNVIADTVLDGKGMGSVLTLINGEDANCALAGFTITHGYAEFGGGAHCSGSSPTIIRCTFTANSANYGGGLANLVGAPTLIGCRFTANRAEFGGAMYNVGHHDSRQTLLTNCAFSGNVVKQVGGGIYNDDANLGLTNCTFAQNSALAGNALACDSDKQLSPTDAHLSNCILWDAGHEVWNSDGSMVTITYSDVQGGQGSIYDPCEGLVWDNSNINADPHFVSVGYWADANDPNIPSEPNDPDAIWIDGDYHLLVGSPCIDAGDSSAVPPDMTDLDADGDANEPTPWDLDGIPRCIDDPATPDAGNGSAPMVDMGAYEFLPSTCLVTLKAVGRPEPSHCTATTVPEHWPTYRERETFYLELWAQITAPPSDSNGLSCAFADVTFDGNIVSAESVEPCTDFATFASGSIEPNRVDELGGCALAGGLGMAPQWALIARIRMNATAEGQTDILLVSADTGCSIIGYGAVPPDQVYFQTCQVTVGDIPDTCLYDLDGDNAIGPGDMAFLACCWLHPAADSGCSGRIPCLDCDFDCDGTVGPGDVAWFATAWLKQCGHASIQLPPCRSEQTAASEFSALPLSSSASDVKVHSVILTCPSLSDTMETLPASISSVWQGQNYYVEVWASDVGTINTGLTSVYVDVDLGPNLSASVQSIDHGGIFTVFASGTIRPGGIEALGGSSLAGAGIEPQWARVATVKVQAATSGPLSCSVGPSTVGIAALGRGLVPWPEVALGSDADCFPSQYSSYNDWVALGKPLCWCGPYQCDGDVDGKAELVLGYRVSDDDLALLVRNWKKGIDDPTLNPCADIDHQAEMLFGYRVYTNDLSIIVANWKKKDADLQGNCPRAE